MKQLLSPTSKDTYQSSYFMTEIGWVMPIRMIEIQMLNDGQIIEYHTQNGT